LKAVCKPFDRDAPLFLKNFEGFSSALFAKQAHSFATHAASG